MKYPEPTPEEREQRRVKAALEKTRKNLERKNNEIQRMAREFYEYWIKEESPIDPAYIQRLAEKAWMAATIYWDHVEAISQDVEAALDDE